MLGSYLRRRANLKWSMMSLTFALSTLMLSSTLSLLLTTAILYIARFFGHRVRINQINFFSAGDLSYSSPACSISIKRLSIVFHLPRPHAPYWAIVTADNYEYKDGTCHVSLDQLNAKLWFFPVFFRFTAGPWISTTLEGFSVRVMTTQNCPLWMERLRNNLIYTVLNGDTIRLGSLNTKLYLSAVTPARDGYGGEVQKPGLNDGEPKDEARVRCSASQWHIFSWHARMYTFGDLVAELRRSWVEDRGTFVMIAKESRWTKVPLLEPEESRKSSKIWQILRALYYFPSNIVKICYDPLSTVDIYVPRCDITFSNFRLRDAELFHQGATELRSEYNKFEVQYPGLLGNIGWDLFVNAVLSTCQE